MMVRGAPWRAARRALSSGGDVADVVVVGGGVVGSSVALHVAARRRDLRVVVVERDSSYARASAPLSAGGIRQQFSNAENVRLSVFGAEFLKGGLRGLLEAAGRGDLADDCGGRLAFREAGYLTLATAQHEGVLRANHATQVANGADWIEVLGADALEDKFPWLDAGGDVVCGAYGTRNEGYFDPWALLDLLRKGAEGLGVEYRGAAAVGFSRPAGGESESEGGPVDGVALADGTVLRCGVAVNCAGAHAAALALPGSRTRLPIAPRKRCVFAISAPEAPPGSARPRPPADAPLTVDTSGCYFRGDLREGKYICGVSPPAHRDGDVASLDDLDVVDHDLFDEAIWPSLAARVPAFEALRVESAWAGLYEYNTLDQNALVGWHPDCANLFVAAGFSGHGLQHAPGVGRAVAEVLDAGHYETIDLAPFSYDRVAENRPFLEANIW